MPRVTIHTTARRLKMLAVLATSIFPVGREDIIDDIGYEMYRSQEDATVRRIFYFDLKWLREEFGADIAFEEGGYVLKALPGEWLSAVVEWRQGHGYHERLPGPPELLTTRQKAHQLGLSPWRVRELARQGALPGRKVRGRWYFEP